MSAPHTFSDDDLKAKLVAGDDSAFSELYERYSAQVYQYIKKFVHSTDLSEDLTQEIFIKIWQCKSKLGEVQSIRAYLFIMARNHTLNSLKKAMRSDVAMAEIVNSFVEERNETEEELLSKEYHEYLERELNALPARTREVFRFCRQQGKSYDEVAMELGISRNAVKNHMVASMKILGASAKRDLGVSLSVLLTVLLK
ncbi:RNA polymerase sigma factor [Pedobacter steynii]|uniref:RNA polymerase sigma-70 factor n=1 Tax=Pedobacter steynii TaxID=430522 RepID=A0A1D7QBQ3_9SPHI|nr:RNA polymerase sigma-70 factor [Pedobacter steynii]AOM76019.1 RNA polymerase sigma-70 factor [Pedobacter steynii]